MENWQPFVNDDVEFGSGKCQSGCERAATQSVIYLRNGIEVKSGLCEPCFDEAVARMPYTEVEA